MSFCAIGDVDQMLFRFAGARPEIMSSELEGYFPDLKTFMLETNYRSSRHIIDMSTVSIASNYSDRGGPYDQALFKESEPREDAPDGAKMVFSMFDFPEEEADRVADTIVALTHNDDYKWGDVFVGARTRAQLAFIEGALTRASIKYVNLCGGSFWDTRHVADVLAYVRLAFDESNDEAFKRVYNIASSWFTAPFGQKKGEYINHRYLGKKFLESVHNSYLNTEHVEWRYKSGAEDLRSLIWEIQAALAHGGIREAINFVINNCYVQWMAADEGMVNTDHSENGKLDDLRTVESIASKFDTPAEFFSYVDDMVRTAREVANGDHSKYVVISTIHRLKGKERPVVFGVGICEGSSTNMMGLTKPTGLLPHTFSLTAPPNFGVLPTGGKGRIEDERCVFFVLISRAKDLVYLSGFRYFRDAEMGPSRFVREIGLVPEKEEEKEDNDSLE